MTDWSSDSDDGDKFDWGTDGEAEPFSPSALSNLDASGPSTLVANGWTHGEALSSSLVEEYVGKGYPEETVYKAIKAIGNNDANALRDLLLAYEAIADCPLVGNYSTSDYVEDDDDLDFGNWDDNGDGEREDNDDGYIVESPLQMMAANRINPYSLGFPSAANTSPQSSSSSTSAAKKARVDEIYSQGMQDVVRLEAAAGGGNSGSARGVAIVQLDINWFRCPVCSRRLSPPVFQCKRGHLACDGCRAGKCRRCKEGGGSFDFQNAVVEDIISVSKFKCPHSGCHGFFPYPELLTHSSACHQAPCFCTEPGCTFAASPTGLLSHLTTNHSWPAHSLTYGKVLWIRAPLSERRRLLLAEEDSRVFVLVVGALGVTTAVSMVCVSASAPGASQPRYTAALHAVRPPPMGCTAMASMETVTSSDRPGEVTVEKLPCVLIVPSTMEQSADGASKEVTLKICVKKVGGD